MLNMMQQKNVARPRSAGTQMADMIAFLNIK